jgi:lipopolysaccharide export system permease protein
MYISRKFINTFIFSLLSLSIIFIIVDLLENLDSFLDRNSTIFNIAEYYIFFIPSILKLLIPIGTLVATLFSIGNLSNQNEIISMKSGSMSLYKIMLPIIFIALFISILQLWLSAYAVPKSNKIKSELSIKYMGKGVSEVYLTNIYLRESPIRNVIIKEFNADNQIGYGLQVNDFSNDKNPRLISRLTAKNFSWDTLHNNWELRSVTKQVFTANAMKEEFLNTSSIKLNFDNKELSELVKPTEQMNIVEWYKFLQFQQRGGRDIQKELTDFYGVIAFPFANFVVILFGVPFASIKRRGGLAVQIGAALVISFVYLIFTKLGQTLGFSIGLTPIISAWLANIVFLISGLVVLFKSPK